MKNKSEAVKFHNITYTQEDREKYENTIPKEITKLGDKCFANCSKLTSIKISSNITKIGGLCFNNCSSLGEIIIPDSVEEIGYDCFSGCHLQIVLPKKFHSICTQIGIQRFQITNLKNDSIGRIKGEHIHGGTLFGGWLW